MTPSRARMSAKSCEIARKFIGIRAIRGVLHGVTGSSEAKSLYDEWLNRGHGVKNGRLDSLRGGLTLFLCPSLRLDEDIDAIDSDVARLRMRLFAIVLDHKIYAATDPPAVMFNRQTSDNFVPRREHSPLH